MTDRETIVVRVLCFAAFAELIGTDAMEMTVSKGLTVGGLIEHIRNTIADKLPPTPLIAVNLRHVPPDTVLEPGDEVALLPPMAGG